MPDITNNYLIGENADDFNSTNYHELAHASHHRVAGEIYWKKFRFHAILNGGDGAIGDFASGSIPGVAALGEAIAEYLEPKYGPLGNGEAQVWRSNFIPSGMLWDFEDPIDPNELIVDQFDASFIVADSVSGFTPAMYFDVLNPDIQSIEQFNIVLKSAYLEDTPTQENSFDRLNDVYDAFN